MSWKFDWKNNSTIKCCFAIKTHHSSFFFLFSAVQCPIKEQRNKNSSRHWMFYASNLPNNIFSSFYTSDLYDVKIKSK